MSKFQFLWHASCCEVRGTWLNGWCLSMVSALYLSLRSEFQFFVLSLSIILNDRAPHGSVIRNRFTRNDRGGRKLVLGLKTLPDQLSYSRDKGVSTFEAFCWFPMKPSLWQQISCLANTRPTILTEWGWSWYWLSSATNTGSRNDCCENLISQP